MDEYAGTDQQSAGSGGDSWQGRVCRPLRQRHQACAVQRGIARDRARSAALRHVRSGQSRQEPGTIHAGHARRRARPGRQPARRQAGVLSRPFARRAGRAGLRVELAGCGEGTDPRSARGTGGISERIPVAPGKTAQAVRHGDRRATSTNGRQVWDQTEHPGERNRAFRAEHPRLLLLQEARSGDGRGDRRARAATS